VFAGIRSLLARWGAGLAHHRPGHRPPAIRPLLNLPAALGIGLLPPCRWGRYGYVDNGSLEGAVLGLLSRQFFAEIASYLNRITYVDLPTCRVTWTSSSRQFSSPHQPELLQAGVPPVPER